MNHYLSAMKNFAAIHKKSIAVGAGIALGVILLAFVSLLFVYNMPKDNYQAVNACKLLTPAKAQDLLGSDKVIGVDTDAPVISGDVSVSKCSYTDTNPDKDKMMVAAIAVQAGINDTGVKQNKADFASKKPSTGVQTIKDLGDSAYFNEALGQLNILDGRQWIILSYGVGSMPQDNKPDKAIELAKKILD